jgi:hypothetical protein
MSSAYSRSRNEGGSAGYDDNDSDSGDYLRLYCGKSACEVRDPVASETTTHGE